MTMNESTCEVCQFGASPIWHANCPDVHKENIKHLRSRLNRACELLKQVYVGVSQDLEWSESDIKSFEEWKSQAHKFLAEAIE